MRNSNSYIRDSSHFLEKIKNIRSIPDNAMLVTADVVGLYPSIPHSAGINSLKTELITGFLVSCFFKTELINKYLQVI